jgi:pimeloyl-ACP methyl ester carboxylesterase
MAEVYIHWRWCILAIITFMALYSPCNAKIQLQKPNLDPDVYCAGHRLGDARHNFVLQPDYQLTPWHDLREGDVFLPLYTNHHFNETEEHLTSAVVFVHGALANADHYWCEAMIAAHMKGDRKDMLVVAPMFGYQQIRGDQWEIMPEHLQKKVKNDASIWFNATCWLQGCNSYDNPANYTSSFDALDQLINTISNTTLFPHIKRVTLVGFSAGGQMINRYAFASLVGATSTLKIRFIVANAGTHLYLNTHRPVESCRLEYDTGSDWSCDTYEVPTKPYLSNVTYTPASPEDMHTQKCEGPWEGYHFDPSSLPVQR